MVPADLDGPGVEQATADPAADPAGDPFEPCTAVGSVAGQAAYDRILGVT